MRSLTILQSWQDTCRRDERAEAPVVTSPQRIEGARRSGEAPQNCARGRSSPMSPLEVRWRDGVIGIEPRPIPVTLERLGRLLVARPKVMARRFRRMALAPRLS